MTLTPWTTTQGKARGGPRETQRSEQRHAHDCASPGRVLRYCLRRPYVPLVSILVLDGLVIFIATLLGLKLRGNPGAFFAEHRPVTWFSACQLAATAGVTGKIFLVRLRCFRAGPAWRAPFFLWLLIAVGLAFAALDELAAIHETVDKLLHQVMRVQETALTDRLDSVLVGGYGLIGLLTLYAFRQEVYRYRAVWPSFGLGVGLFSLMVLLDALSDRADLFSTWGLGYRLYQWTEAVEEWTKVLAEGLFFSTSTVCLALTEQWQNGSRGAGVRST